MAKLMKRIARFDPAKYVNMKLFIIVMAGFVFLSFAISLLIIMVNLQDRKEVEAEAREQASFVQALSDSSDSLSLDDFVFPEQDRFKRTEPFLQREPPKRWDREEIEKYWIDREETGIGEISRYNREMIESMLEDIP